MADYASGFQVTNLSPSLGAEAEGVLRATAILVLIVKRHGTS